MKTVEKIKYGEVLIFSDETDRAQWIGWVRLLADVESPEWTLSSPGAALDAAVRWAAHRGLELEQAAPQPSSLITFDLVYRCKCDKVCCRIHDTHVMPHRGCMLR